MHIQRQGQWVFAIGLVVVFTSVIAGNLIQDELVSLGDRAFLAKHGAIGGLAFFSFAFGFPLGMGVCATGMFMSSEPATGKRLIFALTALLVALSAILVPGVVGRAPSPYFFGTGGYIILGLVLATLWLWGRHRASLQPEARLGADLQGAGYLCFAIVAWNLCGLGGMPSFALDPEKMLAMGSRSFAIGQMKAIMAALLAGWVLTAAGYRMSLKSSQ
jgi:hypothetical protein